MVHKIAMSHTIGCSMVKRCFEKLGHLGRIKFNLQICHQQQQQKKIALMNLINLSKSNQNKKN
jgi:hypothetical protein